MVGRPPKYIFWFSLRFRPVAEPWDVATMFSSALVLMSTTVTVAGLKKTDYYIYQQNIFTPTLISLQDLQDCCVVSDVLCFLFLAMVMDFQLPSLWRLVDMALPTPEPRSKFTFTLPSDSSRDKKSFCRQKNHNLIFVYTVYIYICYWHTVTDTTHHIFSGQIHEQSLRGEGAELKGDGGNVGVPSGGSSHGSVTFTVQLDCPFTVWPLGAAKRQTIFISHLFLNLKNI